MWRALFLGWIAIALSKEMDSDGETTNLSKRQTTRGNTAIYGAAPDQYLLQTSDKVASHSQPQVSADYQQQSELYVISPNRKPSASALTYSNEAHRRPHYIQLSALQLQAAQQVLQHQQLQQQQQTNQQLQQQQQTHQQLHHQPQQLQPQQQISYDTEPGHGAFYRPVQRIHPQSEIRQQESHLSPAPAPLQYATSSVIDSQLYPQAGSFERELAQLVAANRAQEQKYNAAASISAGPGKKISAPQQYLKEITRPVPRPLSAARRAPAAPTTASIHQSIVLQQPQQLYRYLYQPEQLQQQISSSTQQQYKQSPEQQYARPQIQQYLQPQSQHQVSTYADDTSVSGLRAHSSSAARLSGAQLDTPSRSTIYVSQSTPLKKPSYTLPVPTTAERTEEQPATKVPLVRISAQKNKPLTQEEFQQLLQSGGYSATLVPTNDPNSPHQEYLLHPPGVQTAQQPVYTNEKQDAVTYLLPQGHQRPVKRRPIYNVQQA